MTIDDAERLHLLEVARERWADEGAARTLMNLLPPDRDQLATKADLETLRLATKADLEQFRLATHADLEQLRLATKADLVELRGDIRGDLLGRLNSMLLAVVAMWITLVVFVVTTRVG